VNWLFLAVLVIIWAVCIFPRGRGRSSPSSSVADFERGLDLLADTGRAGRWIVAPRKGARFIGARNRARARARGRRRRVVSFLLEATGITLLIALFPPMRPLIFAAAVFALLLVAYVIVLLAVHRNERELGRMRRQLQAELDRPAPARAPTNGPRSAPRPGPAPVPQVIHLEDAHVVIRRAGALETATAR
jgi:Flp pilus assembly protein TadB